MEVKANLLAAAVAGKQSSDMSNMSSSFGIKSSDGLEVVFNKACGLIETGDYPAAKEQLELALREGENDSDYLSSNINGFVLYWRHTM